MTLTYTEQLHHPEWDRRRKAVYRRENHKCQLCQRKGRLTVHHPVYIKGQMLWEYPDNLLICCCFPCHTKRQQIEQSLVIELMKSLHRVSNQRLERCFWRVIHEAMQEEFL